MAQLEQTALALAALHTQNPLIAVEELEQKIKQERERVVKYPGRLVPQHDANSECLKFDGQP